VARGSSDASLSRPAKAVFGIFESLDSLNIRGSQLALVTQPRSAYLARAMTRTRRNLRIYGSWKNSRLRRAATRVTPCAYHRPLYKWQVTTVAVRFYGNARASATAMEAMCPR
jgi:hypothetical protein